MAGYSQFCPIAKAMELLDERWTVLVIRELLAGSIHFNELRRGVPKMSPTLALQAPADFDPRRDSAAQRDRRAHRLHRDRMWARVEGSDRSIGDMEHQMDGRPRRARPRPERADVGYPSHHRLARLAADANSVGVPIDRRSAKDVSMVAHGQRRRRGSV